jgi:hypothetical protein
VSFSARNWLLACGVSCVLTGGYSPAAEPIAADQFQRLHALIKPQTGEDTWTHIPWLSSLWEARRRAAAEGKPILLWEMDGHPLGCT